MGAQNRLYYVARKQTFFKTKFGKYSMVHCYDRKQDGTDDPTGDILRPQNQIRKEVKLAWMTDHFSQRTQAGESHGVQFEDVKLPPLFPNSLPVRASATKQLSAFVRLNFQVMNRSLNWNVAERSVLSDLEWKIFAFSTDYFHFESFWSHYEGEIPLSIASQGN